MWDRQLVRWLRAAGSMQRVGAWIVALVSGFALAAGAPLVGCEAQVTSGEASDADTWSEADSLAPSVDEGLSLVTREGELLSCASPYNTCGASTASLWGVTAYSNAPHQGTTTPCNGLGSHGYQYQCVQYVNRFFMVNQIPGLNTCSFTGVVGNACQWWANAATSGTKQNTCGLSQIPTGSTNMPMPGDVWIYYNGTSCSSSNVGHIAVVHSVTDQSVTVIEQNWACNGLYTHSLTKGGSSSYPTWTPSARGTYKVVGWLRHPHFSTDETTEASPLTITNQSDFGGVINKDNDEDWFKFRPADFIGTGSSLAVTLTARRRDNSGFDAQMDIKNSQKVSLADYGTYQYYRNDDEYDVVAGHATGAKVTAVIPAAEKNDWFYVKVRSYGSSTGQYKLTKSFTPSGSASSGGGCSSVGTIPASGGTVTGTTSGASGAAGTCGGGSAPEKVYAWTPAASGVATLSTCSGTSYDTILYVRSGSCASGAQVASGCNDDACGAGSKVTISVTAGTTYYVFVDGYGSNSGSYSLTVTPPAATATGTCAAPLTVAASGGTYTGTTSGSSSLQGGCGGGSAPEKVYAWTPAVSGAATISTCSGTAYDTLVYVRSGSCGTGSELAGGCNDDACGAGSMVTVNVSAGTTYYIMVDGYGSNSGSYTLTVSMAATTSCPNNCSGHGTCNTSTGVCTCTGGYTGSNCGTAPVVSCPNNCSGHGTCNTSTGVCTCTGGYTGSNCGTAPVVSCPNNCSGHGTCNTSTGVCTCTGGYTGSNCGTAPINWSCANSSYNGTQYWTCSGGSRYRCVNNVPQVETCSQYGCFSNGLGKHDLCIGSDVGWSCSNSSYGGAQWWTCKSDGKLHKCNSSGQGMVVACPSGCNTMALGTNDTCK